MRSKIGVSAAVGALISAAVVTSAYANTGRELIFSAPIQQIDRTTETVTVLGQQFHAPTSQLTAGQVVNVYGVLQKDGSIADAVVQGTTSFGANGDPVFLKGVITDVDAILGRAEIDGMTVDYTAALSDPQFAAPAVGDVIAIAGTEPVAKGVLIATATGDRAYAASMSGGATTFAGVDAPAPSIVTSIGTAIAGMSGGGTAGMSGGGTAGMSGGGTAGMSGGGTAGMSGGGTAGMSGGGTAGMSGGGTAGMSGGGTAGMSGGGTAGMSGGGTAGMSGGGTAGMSGGGTAGMSGGGTAGMSGGGTAGMSGGGTAGMSGGGTAGAHGGKG